MDLTPPGGFLNLLQDPNMASQVAPVGAQQPFLYAHALFPLFFTQPPPAGPTVQVLSSSESGSGQQHRVAATPKAGDDANKRMYYTHVEDLRLVEFCPLWCWCCSGLLQGGVVGCSPIGIVGCWWSSGLLLFWGLKMWCPCCPGLFWFWVCSGSGVGIISEMFCDAVTMPLGDVASGIISPCIRIFMY